MQQTLFESPARGAAESVKPAAERNPRIVNAKNLQSPRERPQGYSTLAPPAADRLARRLRGLSCGRGSVPAGLGVRFVVLHRSLYAQSGFFGSGCAERAEAMLHADGWRLLARNGQIASYGR